MINSKENEIDRDIRISKICHHVGRSLNYPYFIEYDDIVQVCFLNSYVMISNLGDKEINFRLIYRMAISRAIKYIDKCVKKESIYVDYDIE